jgi:tetratricopeptide repeat protein
MIQRVDSTSASKAMVRNFMNQTPQSPAVVSLAGWAACAVLALLVVGCSSSSNSPKQLVNEGRYDEAIELTTQEIASDPNDAQAYFYRGRAYHCRNGQGDVERAIADFSESIRLAPQEPEAYYSRALAYRDHGDADESAADDKTARQLDKRLQEVYAQLPVPPTPAVTIEEAQKPDADKDETASEQPPADEPHVGRGMRGLGDARRDRPEPASSAGDIDLTSPDLGGAGLGPMRRPAEARQPSLGSRSRTSESTRQDDLLADDELGQGIRSPLGRTDPAAREPGNERPRGRRNPVDGLTDPQRPVQPPFRRPLQSPFPQRAPRPTGFVEEAPLTPIRPPRTSTAPPVPTVHPPGAYQFDYNP